MNRKITPFLLMIAILVVSSLACQTLFGGQIIEFTPPDEAVQVTQVVEVTEPAFASQPVISGAAPLDDSLVACLPEELHREKAHQNDGRTSWTGSAAA